MKNFKFLLSVAVATALMGCSSMTVEETESMTGNLPADFDVQEYISLHPELLRVQIKDYVAEHNDRLDKAAKAARTAGDTATYDAFMAAKAADEAAFVANVDQLREIILNYAGNDSAVWEENLKPHEKVVTDYVDMADTFALGVWDKTQADTVFKSLYVCLTVNADSSKTRNIVYADSITLASVKGSYEADSSTCIEAGSKGCLVHEVNCVDSTAFEVDTTKYLINSKVHSNKKAGLKIREYKDSVGTHVDTIPGAIDPSQIKDAKTYYNFYDSEEDLALIKAMEIDYFAISYQYSAFGKEHGWTYRRCKPTDNLGDYLYVQDPTTLEYKATAEYPITKLYCDDNGQARELN